MGRQMSYMTDLKSKKIKSGAGLLIFLGWLMYSVSYLGKVNYSANITQITDFYHITKAEAGLVPTFFFFAYGIGQVVNGILCKRYNIKWMIFISLSVSAVINFIIAVTACFDIIKWLWMINGFALSILWPTLVRLLAEALPQKDLGKSSLIMGTTVASGTIIIYGLSAVYALFDKFNLAFYTAAIAGILTAVAWLILYKKAINMAKSQRFEESFKGSETQNTKGITEQNNGEKKLFYTSIYILCFFAIGINLIKDGLVTWVPSILKEEYSMTNSISILLTLLLPIVAIFGNAGALGIHKKIPDYVTHCFVVFAVIGTFIGLIIGSLALKQAALMLVGLVVVYFLASSLNSVVTSIFPLFMRGKVNSGLYAGVLNGFCYLGSTISSYGLGFIADHLGWAAVFWVLIGFCIAVAVIWFGYISFRRILKNKIRA